ncbi:hypothetical protein A2U01_0048999 [Trifolium medium]|uniref:Uncharacterized protein n=1 Tax=Trifolium medium TaxID=97028 RepID=A0A392QUW1_9FABA|nr:hypothetical protein [Trifolium medium]
MSYFYVLLLFLALNPLTIAGNIYPKHELEAQPPLGHNYAQAPNIQQTRPSRYGGGGGGGYHRPSGSHYTIPHLSPPRSDSNRPPP